MRCDRFAGRKTDPFPTPDSVKLAIAEQLCELEQFAGPVVDDYSPPVSAPIAELEAELMLMTPQDIPKPGCSRSLPKAMKTNNKKKAKAKAKAKTMAATSKRMKTPNKNSTGTRTGKPKAKETIQKDLRCLQKYTNRSGCRVRMKLKTDPVRLAGSKAWHQAKTAAMKKGMSYEEACEKGRIAADKARKKYRESLRWV